MLTRSDLKNTISLVGAEGISRGMAFVLTILIARQLGVVQFGLYGTAVSFVFLFSVFIEVGLSTYVFREIAKNRQLASQYIVNALGLQALLAIVVGLIVFAAARILNYPADTRMAITLFWFWMVTISLGRMIRVVFKANQRMEIEAAINIFENGIRFALVLIVLWLGYGVLGIAIASIVSGLLMLTLSALVAANGYFRFANVWNMAFMVDLAKSAIPFALSVIATVIMYRLSIVLLSVIKGNYAVGVFDASFKLTMAMFFIPGLICQAFFPKMSLYAVADDDRFRKTVILLIRYIFLLMYPFLMLIFIFAPLIIGVIYTDDFSPTIPVLRILVWVNVFNAGTYIGIYALNAAGYEKNVMRIMISALIIKFLISLFLIMQLSYIGAAIGALMSEFVVMSLLLYYLRRETEIEELPQVLFRVIGVIVISFGAILLGGGIHLGGLTIAILFIGTLFASAGISKLVTISDMNSLRRLVFSEERVLG